MWSENSESGITMYEIRINNSRGRECSPVRKIDIIINRTYTKQNFAEGNETINNTNNNLLVERSNATTSNISLWTVYR